MGVRTVALRLVHILGTENPEEKVAVEEAKRAKARSRESSPKGGSDDRHGDTVFYIPASRTT